MLTHVVVSGEGITDIGKALNDQPVAHDEYIETGPCLINKGFFRQITIPVLQWCQSQHPKHGGIVMLKNPHTKMVSD